MRLLALTLLLPFLAAAEPAPPDDGVRVAVLGYHDFSETEPETEMRIRTSKFRDQMQRLKDLGLPVVSMADFQAWKRGEKSLPPQCVVITIDDGWKAVFTDAFPVLKDFGYPFTLFLYKNYVDGGGKALTSAMVEEMKQHGATIGSHSVSHPYPGTVKKQRAAGPDAYDAFLRDELGESKRFLEAKFGEPVTTYAYPGGFHTAEMLPLADEFGYQHLFTVIPAKVKRDSDNRTLPRYVVLGTHDPIFELAVRFQTPSSATADAGSLAYAPPTVPYPVEPEPGTVLGHRLPRISADLSNVPDLDPATLSMKVSGFGEVPATWDAETSSLTWQANRRLRLPVAHVQITWRDNAGKAPEKPLRWSFQLDREAAYVPQE